MTNMNDFVVNLKLTKKMDLDSKMWFFIFGEKKHEIHDHISHTDRQVIFT